MNATVEKLIADSEKGRPDREERRARFNQALLLIILALLAIIYILGFVQSLRQPKVSELVISDAKTIGATDLCPGESLVFQFEYSVLGEGKLDFDITAWFVDPPKRIIFTETQPFLMAGEVREQVQYLWPVPLYYTDLATQLPAPLPPGNYQLNFGLTSPSRSAISEVEKLEFSIRADCP